MFKVSTKSESNAKQFDNLVKQQINKSLYEIGVVGLSNIKPLTPVITGELRNGNIYKVNETSVIFDNGIEYAPSVELGTRYAPAQSFIRRGINNSLSYFANIIKKNMRA